MGSAGRRGCWRRRWTAALAVLLVACEGAPSTPAPTTAPTTAPQPARPAAAAGPVRLELGDDLGAVVEAHPPGTAFVIAAGLHREQRIEVRDGDTFTGEEGAVLSGARVLEEVRRDGDLWVATAGPIGDPIVHGDMQEGWEREANPQDLWVADQRQRHVASVDLVAPGTWFFDYEAGEVVFGQDPAGEPVELAVTDFAFVGEGTRGVTIEGVTVQRYGTTAQRGAISAYRTREWTLRDVVADSNHGAGIRVGSGTVLEGCQVRDNGQIGVVGGGQEPGDRAIVVTGCEISGNGQLGYRWQWEAGGTKFFSSVDMEFVDNVVSDNLGPGVWFDGDNVDALIRDNVVTENSARGIWYEISFGAVIEDNVVTGNGHGVGENLSAGIVIANASDVTVRGNEVAGNRFEIFATDYYDRGDGDPAPWRLTGLTVVDNEVTISDGTVGLYVYDGGDPAVLHAASDNTFTGNRYVLEGCDPCFWWGEALDQGGWQALGLDRGGSFASVE